MDGFKKVRAQINGFDFNEARLLVSASRVVLEDHPQGQVMDFEFFKLQAPGAVVIRGRGRVRMVAGAEITVTCAEVVLFEWKKKIEPGEFGFSLKA